MFENEGIEYIGVEKYLKKNHNPYTSNWIKYINKDYYEVRDEFKDDVIISNLCVGYLIPIKDIKAKHLIVGSVDEKGICSAKIVY